MVVSGTGTVSAGGAPGAVTVADGAGAGSGAGAGGGAGARGRGGSRRRGRGGSRRRGQVRVALRCVAAAARVGLRPRLRRLIERDRDEPVAPVRGRPLDPRDDVAQERVGRRETRGGPRRARRVAAVVAAVGHDVGERRRRGSGSQVGRQATEVDVVGRARPAVEQRVEVDERVAPGHVRVAGTRRGLCVRPPEHRMAASPHDALHVRAPRLVRGHELVGQRLRPGRVHAPIARHLAVVAHRPRRDVDVRGAVRGRRVRRPWPLSRPISFASSPSATA